MLLCCYCFKPIESDFTEVWFVSEGQPMRSGKSHLTCLPSDTSRMRVKDKLDNGDGTVTVTWERDEDVTH